MGSRALGGGNTSAAGAGEGVCALMQRGSRAVRQCCLELAAGPMPPLVGGACTYLCPSPCALGTPPLPCLLPLIDCASVPVPVPVPVLPPLLPCCPAVLCPACCARQVLVPLLKRLYGILMEGLEVQVVSSGEGQSGEAAAAAR